MNHDNKLVAVVGMCGSGKGEACRILEEEKYYRFQKIYFGQITMDEIERRNLTPGEVSERKVREELRTEFGMAAYAIKNEPKIREALKNGHVVIDGMYSWEERQYLKEKFPEMKVLAIYASPETRKKRLAQRSIRPLTSEEVDARDKAEIENIAKAGPIVVADYTIVNEHGMDFLHMELEAFLHSLSFCVR